VTNDPNITWYPNDICENDPSPQKPTNLYNEFSQLFLDNEINASLETFHDSSTHIPRSPSPTMRRPQRVINPYKRLLESIEGCKPIKSKPKSKKQALLVNTILEPSTIKQALASSNAREWQLAIDFEI
jgi:hypothetical protein